MIENMWAFLVLTLALAVRASETNNDTAVEENSVIARGKLLVSSDRNLSNTDNFQMSSRWLVMSTVNIHMTKGEETEMAFS